MRRLADLLEAISQTTSKLAKRDLVANYLQTLADEELRIACTYLTGLPFPAGDGRALNVGWSAIVEALLDVSGATGEALDQAYLRHGDLGAAARDLLEERRRPPLFRTPLTLPAVDGAFTQMAGAAGKGSRQVKIDGMHTLLSDADPLEAKFLIRIITSDLRVGLKQGLLEEAIAKAFDAPVAAVRRANMLVSDIGMVAVMARHGTLDQATLTLFRPFHFMLAETVFSPEEAFASLEPVDGAAQPTLVVEDKYDGIRAQVHYDGERLAIYSRTLDEITPSFPELHADLRALGHQYIVDGEIIAWKDGKAIPFSALQQRLRRKDPTDLMRSVPVVMFAFDLLLLDGSVLMDRPLFERRKALVSLGPRSIVQQALWTVAESPAELASRFREARDRGNEGLVIKRPNSPYQPGRRGRQWVKLKEELATLDVVVVAAEHGHGKRASVLSDVTFAVRNGDALVTIGKAYSGLTDVEIKNLTEWFKQHTIKDLGRVKLVEPKIVLEVAFDAVMRSDRHESGYALRFPRIKRIRDDKAVEDINTLDDAKRIFEHQGDTRGGSSPKLTKTARGER